jgi:RimJ/RimL family protein N-acetyltransferase
MMPTIATTRLTLRDFAPDDFDAFFATSNDPEYRRFYSERKTTRAFWGQGYAFEASRCILDFGCASLPIHRIYAETISENRRARELAERLELFSTEEPTQLNRNTQALEARLGQIPREIASEQDVVCAR